ncbi:Histone-lysine N-methyltransferase [Quillaja saponaria]|uniref:Histone-lysine N-methyltransferase n=1 Tax=Quillaja saponaria TaxID=32244 RepID=A0AAD7VIM8_QUISA|nr:Histone-lysine N-methyltransferase [Quillaja saponaria]KAJ7977182.1 Histone-lysine N-methyltransferase [Quillaja saponaria]
MAPNRKVQAAYRAMTDLGISNIKVKPVLKKLLQLYDKNWELIEEENYRVLADAIFEEEENEVMEPKSRSKNYDEEDLEEAQTHDDSVRPLKRLRFRGQDGQASQSHTICNPTIGESSLKRPKLEEDALPESCSPHKPQYTAVSSRSDVGHARTELHPVSAGHGIVDKGKQPMSPQISPRGTRFVSERASLAVCIKEPRVEPGIMLFPKNKVPDTRALIKPKDEPVDDELPRYEIPIAVIRPDSLSKGDSSVKSDSTEKQDGHDALEPQCRDEEVRADGIQASAIEGSPNCKVATVPEELCSNVEIASSPLGEEGSVKEMPTVDIMKNANVCDALDVRGGKEDLGMPCCISNGTLTVQCSTALAEPLIPILPHPLTALDNCGQDTMKVMESDPETDDSKLLEDPEYANSRGLLVVPQYQPTPDDLRFFNDITKGEERVRITWVNEINDEYPQPFHYIPQNLVFQDAYVNISLSIIGEEDCCSTCLGNCLLSPTPCACAYKTQGGFAYTSEGLVKEEFLEEYIAISHSPQRHLFYCKDCPVERSKNDDCLEPCKGHLKRKFIKECWSKCGCNKHCGNRVVQRGIACNLQVFYTSDGKGWGLRTLEELPKGAFVCEFVGEVLTTRELYERNMQCTKSGKCTYPVLLDANWISGVLKDEETLCLDASSFSNVARFINHRCLDANLIEIPVEVETPAHHYYHLAFFTSRKVDALEELTWDYGIDFDDQDLLAKVSCCRCGSKFCRNMKRSSRSSRVAIAR